MLTSDQRAALTQKLEQIEKDISVQIVVLTLPSLEGEPIEDLAVGVAQKWGIGEKSLNNGAVVVVAKNERKIRIEVGYGLEPVIPDGLAGRIIREQISPHFKQNDFYGGLDAGVDAIARAARNEYPLTSPEQPSSPDATGGFLSCFFAAGILWFILAGIFARFRSGGWIAGGFAAAVLFPGALFYCNLISPRTSLVLSPFGFFLGALATPIVRRMQDSSGARSRRDNTWTYPGGGFGDWRGGGGGGGGFSGGGGHFGGGGASGGW